MENWYKGSLHCHSLWSDGDDFPEMILSWYRDKGYHFAAISDHNAVHLNKDEWVELEQSEENVSIIDKYNAAFGNSWTEIIESPKSIKVRLKTYKEYSKLFNQKDFLVFPALEISDKCFTGNTRWYNHVHLNVLNIEKIIPTMGGIDVESTLRNNLDRFYKEQKDYINPIIIQINHPNLYYTIPLSDLLSVDNYSLFEIYNGHYQARNEGDEYYPSTDRMWDILLTKRIHEGKNPLFGLAVDDAHHYHDFSIHHANPGRAWIVVKADKLDRNSIVKAIGEGRFYSSTGVVLSKLECNGSEINIALEYSKDEDFEIIFSGTEKDFDQTIDFSESRNPYSGLNQVTPIYSSDIGKVFQRNNSKSAVYKFNGDELYVRVKVISSKLKENPSFEGEKQICWTQPFFPGKTF